MEFRMETTSRDVVVDPFLEAKGALIEIIDEMLTSLSAETVDAALPGLRSATGMSAATGSKAEMLAECITGINKLSDYPSSAKTPVYALLSNQFGNVSGTLNFMNEYDRAKLEPVVTGLKDGARVVGLLKSISMYPTISVALAPQPMTSKAQLTVLIDLTDRMTGTNHLDVARQMRTDADVWDQYQADLAVAVAAGTTVPIAPSGGDPSVKNGFNQYMALIKSYETDDNRGGDLDYWGNLLRKKMLEHIQSSGMDPAVVADLASLPTKFVERESNVRWRIQRW